MEILIVGAGIGGLTLALSLHQAGISCRVFEAVAQVKPLGVGIIDARALTGCLKRGGGVPAALEAYEALRMKPAYDVVLMNRKDPPDAVLREVHRRTGDKPFGRIEDVATNAELVSILETYKRVAGFDREGLAKRASLV